MINLYSPSLLTSLVDYLKALIADVHISFICDEDPVPEFIKDLIGTCVESVLTKIGFTEEAVREYDEKREQKAVVCGCDV